MKKLNRKLSRKIAKQIEWIPSGCFINAYMGLKLMPSLKYCEGHAANVNAAIEHGWLETESEIIDPTLSFWEDGKSDPLYFPMIRYGAIRVQQCINKQTGEKGVPLIKFVTYGHESEIGSKGNTESIYRNQIKIYTALNIPNMVEHNRKGLREHRIRRAQEANK